MKNCTYHPHKKLTQKCSLCQVRCCEECGKICKACITKIGAVVLVLMCVSAGIIFFGIL